MSRVRSIRRFLLSGILALVSLSLAVSGLIGYLEANHEMEELFDARLAQSARITNQLLSRYLKQRGELPNNGAVYQEWEQAVPDDLASGEAQLQPAGAGQRVHPLRPRVRAQPLLPAAERAGHHTAALTQCAGAAPDHPGTRLQQRDQGSPRVAHLHPLQRG
jgi:hypothetical protein